MNYDRLTAVEVKVKRNRTIRMLVLLALIAWLLYYVFSGDWVLAHHATAAAML